MLLARSALVALLLVLPLADAGAQAPGGTLTIVVNHFGKEVLDRGHTGTQDLQYNGHPYEALVGTARNGELTADRGLAESWRMSPDARSMTVRLRKNVRWHDGKPFTADDVVFSLMERYRAKETSCTFCGLLRRTVKSVKAVDPHTVQIELTEPDLTFPALLSSRDGDLAMLARHNFRPKDDGWELVGPPIGTGPWKFVEFKRGVEIRYEANADYWDRARVPEFATLRVVPRPDPASRLAMVKAGEADMAQIDAAQAPDAKAAGLRLSGVKGATISVLTFLGCWQKEMLCNRTEFRKAMVLAIDMKSIVKRVFPDGTGTQIPTAIWTEVALGYDPTLALYPYDPAEARRILQQIRYDGKPVKLWSAPLAHSPETPEIMELVQGYLAAAGFKTELTPIEFGAFRPRYARSPQTFETTYAAHLHVNVPFARPWVMENLSVSWISQAAGGLIQGYWDLARIDAEFRRLRQIGDLKTLADELRRLNRETYAEYPFYPIAARNTTFAVGPRVADWSPGDYGVAWHIETVKPRR
jgi:peptide/nickel transport system substrate-binding protein